VTVLALALALPLQVPLPLLQLLLVPTRALKELLAGPAVPSPLHHRQALLLLLPC
jgi:hypothetical protein